MVPTGAEAVVEEGTLGGKSAPAIHGEILAELWMSFTATVDPWAREAIACFDSVELLAISPELAVTVLVELAHHGHLDFLLILSETGQPILQLLSVRAFCSADDELHLVTVLPGGEDIPWLVPT